MDVMTYSKARANLARTMELVCDNHEPVIITKKEDNAVVMISLEDYRSMEETAYLLRSPEEKKKSWDDLQQVMRVLGLSNPG